MIPSKSRRIRRKTTLPFFGKDCISRRFWMKISKDEGIG
jgi:hypothetical protein